MSASGNALANVSEHEALMSTHKKRNVAFRVTVASLNDQKQVRNLKFCFIFHFFRSPGCSHAACTIPTWSLSGRGRGPLTHLCDLEAGYWCVWAPNFGEAAPGFEPRTSCLRVRSVPITLCTMGAASYFHFISVSLYGKSFLSGVGLGIRLKLSLSVNRLI